MFTTAPREPSASRSCAEHHPQDRRGREDVAARVQRERPVPGVRRERVERTVPERPPAATGDVQEAVDASERAMAASIAPAAWASSARSATA